MKKTVTITIDVEHDCPPYLTTYRGVETGLPLLCSVLDRYDIEATFFVTGDVASKYPDMIKRIAERHEIGCHGYSHKRFDRMTRQEASEEIGRSTDVLHKLAASRVVSFRAPNLRFPSGFLNLLNDNGYLIDSSLARYKLGYIGKDAGKNPREYGIGRIPVSITSSFLRFPFGNEIIKHLPQPIVLFFHPWEFIAMQNEPVRWDCKFNTGEKALMNLESLIRSFITEKYDFCSISKLVKMQSQKL